MNLSDLEQLADGGTLSPMATAMMAKWIANGKIVPVDKTWDRWHNLFMGIAYKIASRSCDSQQKNGAVIVNNRNHIQSVGYNGHVAGIVDDMLPNVRPDKYPWMLHAELNAILNCERRPEGCTIYVTGHPCLHCFQCIAQSGISTIIYDKNQRATMVDEEMQAQLEIIRLLTRNKVKVIEYDYQERK